MNLRSCLGTHLHFRMRRSGAAFVAILVALVWSSRAFCDEIHDAAKKGDVAKVQALLKGNPNLALSRDDEFGNTPLHGAAGTGHKEVAELLLAGKADVNARNNGGATPLHWAAAGGQETLVEFLLTNGAQVNAASNDGSTPLHGAANGKVAQLLLAHAADVHARKHDSSTPLHAAALHGHKDVVELLLTAKADPNAKDSYGNTPLHDAAFGGHAEVAELLLTAKVDINAKNNFGETPLRWATTSSNRDTREVKEVTELLRQHGGELGKGHFPIPPPPPPPPPPPLAVQRAPGAGSPDNRSAQGQVIPVVVRGTSDAKQAEAVLILAVSWIFAGKQASVTEPSADIVDPADGRVVERGFSKLAGTSGIGGSTSGVSRPAATLLFSTIYKKKDETLRVYFKADRGNLELWWSNNVKPAADQSNLIQLNPASLAGATELPPTPDHPTGGLSIPSHTPDGRLLVFYIEFTEVRTLAPGPKIRSMGIATPAFAGGETPSQLGAEVEGHKEVGELPRQHRGEERRVSPELPFEAKGLAIAGQFSTDGEGYITSSTGMSLTSLYLQKLEIPLESTSISSDNLLKTKDYGVLEIRVNLARGIYLILVTPEQEERFKSLCRQGRCE